MKSTEGLDEILTELKIIMVQKNQDYGPYNIANAPGGAMNGLLVRMHDKMERLQHLYRHRRGDTPNYESIEDTLKDGIEAGQARGDGLRKAWTTQGNA